MPKPSDDEMKRRSLVESLEENDEDDEFFDAREQMDDSVSLAKWSSMELENVDMDAMPNARVSALKVLNNNVQNRVA